MTFRRRSRIAALVVLLLALAGAAVAWEETVAFNTESKKFHCLSCEWAKRCTVNCIELPRSEAIRRGGVACKVCGGTCGPTEDLP